MSVPSGFEFENFDFDVVWSAISKSTKLRAYMENLGQQVAEEATALARAEAYDEGYYADLFEGGAASASEVRRVFNQTWQERRNRRRRGQEGKNRLLDRPKVAGADGKPVYIKGDPDGSEFSGSIGYVINKDFKAAWVEYGSIAKGPRFILNRASETVAERTGNDFERLYDKTHEQNVGELAQKISAGQTGKKRPRKTT